MVRTVNETKLYPILLSGDRLSRCGIVGGAFEPCLRGHTTTFPVAANIVVLQLGHVGLTDEMSPRQTTTRANNKRDHAIDRWETVMGEIPPKVGDDQHRKHD